MTLTRIVIPVLGFVPSGGNRVLCHLATEFVRMGLAVDFLVLDDESCPPFPTEARVVYTRAVHPSCAAARGSGKISILRNVFRLARALRRKRADYDIALASFSLVALACALGGLRSHTLYYVQSYEPEIFASKRKLGSWIGAGLAFLSYWACRHQVVNSPHYIGYSGISATTSIPPGIDALVFQPKQGGLEFDDRTIRIGIIGRREPHKYAPVMAGYRAIVRQHPRCKLLVAYGNVPTEVLTSAGPYEIVVPRCDAELAAFYRSCDVFLALSEFPKGAFYPPLEALASGTLLISNRFLCVTDDNAWVVEGPEQVCTAFDAVLASTTAERAAKQAQGIRVVSSELRWPELARRFIRFAEASIPAPRHMSGGHLE